MTNFVLDYIGNFYSWQAPNYFTFEDNCEIVIKFSSKNIMLGDTGLELEQELKTEDQDLAFGSTS